MNQRLRIIIVFISNKLFSKAEGRVILTINFLGSLTFDNHLNYFTAAFTRGITSSAIRRIDFLAKS